MGGVATSPSGPYTVEAMRVLHKIINEIYIDMREQ
jgi:hypothetical protein